MYPFLPNQLTVEKSDVPDQIIGYHNNLSKASFFACRQFLRITFPVVFFLSFSTQVNAQETLMGLTSNGGPEGKGTAFTIKTNGTGFAIVKAFADWGKNPTGGLIQGPDGNFYGMVNVGGTYGNYGTIFKMTPTGVMTILHQFNYSTDGGYPYGNLTLGNDGNFYGLTSGGGPTNGTIFRITPAGVFTVIRAFVYGTEGAGPEGQMVLAPDGNFYGITRRGGSTGFGTIFKFNPAGTGTFTVIKTLNGTTDGGYCYGSLTRGSDGNFYGITTVGGTFKYGTIFKITPAGVYTVIRNFNATTDGSPSSGRNSLVQHSDGFLYAALCRGGANGNGTIIKINTTGTIFSVLRHLQFAQGGSPVGSLIVGTDGFLYGMAPTGGTKNGGTIFKISSSGTLTVLRSLKDSTDGASPRGNLLKGKDGNYYGMTYYGGTNLYGTIFKINSTGTSFTILARLNGGIQGGAPQESLVQGKDNAFYGTTLLGGTSDWGTVFKLCGATTTTLRSFKRNPEGNSPRGSLIQATDGNFYGTASAGGSSNAGLIFKITPTGVYTVLHNFIGPSHGGTPQGTLLQGTDGYLYGTTNSGGMSNGGTIYKISTAGAFKVIRHLNQAADGGNPEGNLIKGVDSFYYGVNKTNSRIFKISPNGAIFSVLKILNSTTEGHSPIGGLVLGKDGNFYGTCSGGGAFGRGTIFKMTPSGTFTLLKALKESSDGAYPFGTLVQAADGNFYGMTSAGGSHKAGTIFRITPTGTYTVLRHLNLVKDGGAPLGSLIIQKTNPIVANPQNTTTGEDSAKAIVLTGTGGTPLIYTITTQPKNGTITTGTSANRTYKPKLNYSGKDSFYFIANVGCMSSVPAKVIITIRPVNDSPVLAPIGNRTTKVGTLLTFTATATDVDAGQTKTFSLIGAPAGATIGATTGAFSWKPTAAGSFTFKVRVTDNGSPVRFDEEQIIVTVTAAAITSSTPLITQLETQSSVLHARLYPNPVREKCIVKFDHSPGNVSVILTDMKGAVLKNWTMKNSNTGILEFDIGKLTAGQYILHVHSPEKAYVFKLVKL